MNAKEIKYGTAGALITLLIISLFYMVWRGISHDYRNSYEHFICQNLKQINLACSMYYDDNNEMWPVNLSALDRKYFAGETPKFRLPGVDSDWEFDWIYIRPYVQKNVKDSYNPIILATPTSWNHDRRPAKKNCKSFRIVVYYSGKIEKISDEEYQKKINHNAPRY